MLEALFATACAFFLVLFILILILAILEVTCRIIESLRRLHRIRTEARYGLGSDVCEGCEACLVADQDLDADGSDDDWNEGDPSEPTGTIFVSPAHHGEERLPCGWCDDCRRIKA